MNFHFVKILLIFYLLIVPLSISCHHTNPAAPQNETEEETGEWTNVTLPAFIQGDWYVLGHVNLIIGQDTLKKVDKYTGYWNIIAVESRGSSQYRLILRNGKGFYQYTFLKIIIISENDLEVAFASEIITKEEEVRGLPLEKSYLVTAQPSWIPAVIDENFTGNWHHKDGEMEIKIDKNTIQLDGLSWDIVAVETDDISKRLILKNGSDYKAFYYRPPEKTYEKHFLATFGSGTAGSLEKARQLTPVEWKPIFNWQHILEFLPLALGARWVYDYSYYASRYEGSDPEMPHLEATFRNGIFEFEVIGEALTYNSRIFTLKATYKIDSEKHHIITSGRNWDHNSPDFFKVSILDTTWVISNFASEKLYTLVLENDTLWYDNEKGRTSFSTAKVQYATSMNLNLFDYQGQHVISYSANVDLDRTLFIVIGKGITYVHYFSTEGEISNTTDELTFTLTEYVPGAIW